MPSWLDRVLPNLNFEDRQTQPGPVEA
jgi:hypothetical protein